MKFKELENSLYNSINADPCAYSEPEVARLTIHENKVINQNLVQGLNVIVNELAEGVDISMELEDNVVVKKPVCLCFGVLPEKGIQKIIMNVSIGKNSKIEINAHCTFPNAVEVLHTMDANIALKEGADYSYFERHVHSDTGGVTVVPKAVAHIGDNACFKTEFELVKGRVGKIDILYETYVRKNGLVDMKARISGKGDDKIKVKEISFLEGEYSRAALTSKIAVRDNAESEVYNKIVALAPYARGHVDCKEIVKDNGIATAIPIVDVRNSLAHVTHEAAVGSVDKKQLETLMSRGLNEDEASEMIIQGMLS